MNPPFPVSTGFLLFWSIIVWTLTAVVHIALAAGVLSDSYRFIRRHNRGTFLVGGGMWALAVLLGGVVAAGIYWVIHHSSLRPERLRRRVEEPTPQEEPIPAPQPPPARPPGADY